MMWNVMVKANCSRARRAGSNSIVTSGLQGPRKIIVPIAKSLEAASVPILCQFWANVRVAK
jgi:hypothetical protein